MTAYVGQCGTIARPPSNCVQGGAKNPLSQAHPNFDEAELYFLIPSSDDYHIDNGSRHAAVSQNSKKGRRKMGDCGKTNQRSAIHPKAALSTPPKRYDFAFSSDPWQPCAAVELLEMMMIPWRGDVRVLDRATSGDVRVA